MSNPVKKIKIYNEILNCQCGDFYFIFLKKTILRFLAYFSWILKNRSKYINPILHPQVPTIYKHEILPYILYTITKLISRFFSKTSWLPVSDVITLQNIALLADIFFLKIVRWNFCTIIPEQFKWQNSCIVLAHNSMV